jgi:transposase InsO family protein
LWNKIRFDIFEIKGRNYLIAVDYYSNFIEVDYLSKMKSSQMIRILKKHFARYGIPSTVMSDNGPQFVSRQFELFLSNWKVNHATSSPGHQQSNGKAEAAVKIVKTLMKKTVKDGCDRFEALLEQRNTPRQDTGLSPVEMMFGRKTRTMLPFLNKCSETNRGRENRKLTVKKHHDKLARDLPKLKEGQSVFFD